MYLRWVTPEIKNVLCGSVFENVTWDLEARRIGALSAETLTRIKSLEVPLAEKVQKLVDAVAEAGEAACEDLLDCIEAHACLDYYTIRWAGIAKLAYYGLKLKTTRVAIRDALRDCCDRATRIEQDIKAHWNRNSARHAEVDLLLAEVMRGREDQTKTSEMSSLRTRLADARTFLERRWEILKVTVSFNVTSALTRVSESQEHKLLSELKRSLLHSVEGESEMEQVHDILRQEWELQRKRIRDIADYNLEKCLLELVQCGGSKCILEVEMLCEAMAYMWETNLETLTEYIKTLQRVLRGTHAID